jgi:hypothetical protein
MGVVLDILIGFLLFLEMDLILKSMFVKSVEKKYFIKVSKYVDSRKSLTGLNLTKKVLDYLVEKGRIKEKLDFDD